MGVDAGVTAASIVGRLSKLEAQLSQVCVCVTVCV